MRLWPVLVLSLSLAACGRGPDVVLLQHNWGDVVLQVESRPSPVRLGMNEFLIIASDARGAPVHDLWVGLRMEDQDPWAQAIQDGFSGVYRKALAVGSLQQQLQLKIRRGQEETLISTALVPSPTATVNKD